jgi:hypothetical protein
VDVRRRVFAVLGAALAGASLLPWWNGTAGLRAPSVAVSADAWRASSWWAVAVLLGLAGCVAALRRRPAPRWVLLLPVLGLGVLAVETAVVLDVVQPRDLVVWDRGEPPREEDRAIVDGLPGGGPAERMLDAVTGSAAYRAGVAPVLTRIGPRDVARNRPGPERGSARDEPGPAVGLGAGALLLAAQAGAALGLVAAPGRTRGRGRAARAGGVHVPVGRRVVVALLGTAVAVSTRLDWWRPPGLPPSLASRTGPADTAVWWVLAVAAGVLAAGLVVVTGRAARVAGVVALAAAGAVVLETVVRGSGYGSLQPAGVGAGLAAVLLVVLGGVLVRTPVAGVQRQRRRTPVAAGRWDHDE